MLRTVLKFVDSTTSVFPLPVTTRVPIPLAGSLVEVRAVVDRNDPRVVDHLAVQHDVPWRLKDQRSVVVRGGHHHAEYTPRNAAVPRFHVLVRVVQTFASMS